jgi:hypothetical protein
VALLAAHRASARWIEIFPSARARGVTIRGRQTARDFGQLAGVLVGVLDAGDKDVPLLSTRQKISISNSNKFGKLSKLLALDMEKSPIAFLSYAHKDDQHGRVSELRNRLNSEVEMATGAEFTIFQDRKDIHWGMAWRDRIERSLDGVTFLIPILTPSFFRSEACRGELQRFLQREKDLGRRDLILPIYYIQADVIDDQQLRQGDPLATELYERQYVSWRHLRHKDFENEEVRAELEKLALQIKSALFRTTKTLDVSVELGRGQTKSLTPDVDANALLERARVALAASDYVEAESLAVDATRYAKTQQPDDVTKAFEGYLLAAEAAVKQNKMDQADHYLKHAEEFTGNRVSILAARCSEAWGNRHFYANDFYLARSAYGEAERQYELLSDEAPADEKEHFRQRANDMMYLAYDAGDRIK